jgi:type II secretory pathway component GspD/PulD (secretin)
VPSGNTVITATEEIIQAASNTPGFNFNNSPLGNSGSDQALARSSTVGTQGLSSFAVGRINNELGFGGLVLSASSESVSMLIRALEESRRLEILSRPQIRTLDNQPAMIQVGQNVPFILNSTITQFGQTNSIEFRDVGLILGVTPRISPDGTVVMEIDAEKSTLGPEEQGIPIAATIDGTIIRAPSIETTRAQTTVSAASGETIVLGGLITKSTAVISRSVPYLSDIPVLGDIFRYDGVVKRRTELMIILTPQVIYSATDNERIKQIEMARMSWCTADVYDLHGDVDYHFPEDVTNFDEPTEVIYPDVQPRGNADAVDENDIDERQQ